MKSCLLGCHMSQIFVPVKSDLAAHQFAAGFTQSLSRTDKAESEMESKASVPSPGPSVCHLSINAIEAADGSNGHGHGCH